MKRKGWFIPILVFFISFISLIFYQKRQDINTFADTTSMTPILWSKSPSDIIELNLSLADTKIKVIYNEGEWQLVEPFSDSADSLYIYNVISAFTHPIFESVIETEPTRLSQYGITEASAAISLFDKEGHEYTLIKGNAADSLHDYVYAPTSNTVYTLPSSAFSTFTMDSNKWRNKEVLGFNRTEIEKITLTSTGQVHELTPVLNEANEIIFSSTQLDEHFINRFISFLETSKIQKFITDNPDSSVLEAYGFTSPSMIATIYLSNNDSVSLKIGNILKEENICYVQREGSNSILGIPYFDLSQLNIKYKN